MAEPVDNVAWALKALNHRDRLLGYQLADRYYDGEHSLTFATEKFRSVFGRLFRALADNLCPAVVDSIADRLKVTGVDAGDVPAASAELADQAWQIWLRNRMDVRAPETHHDALLDGDGYALVYPNQAGEAVIWSLPPGQVAVSYDRNAPGVIRRAARIWHDEDDQRVHLDLYFPDRVQRFVSKGPRRRMISSSTKPDGFVPYVTADVVEPDGTILHPWGTGLPLFHFPNRRFHCYGVSELKDVIPLQDALNKALCDMLVAMEFSAFRQRWATGIEVGETDDQGRPKAPPFDYGVDRMLTAPTVEAKFGDFQSTDLTQYIEVQESLRSEIARVSGTPLHYLFITRGDFPSGEAMKSAEARFTRKVEQRQASFGNTWEDVLALALRIESDTPSTTIPAGALSLQWEPASPTASSAGEPVATAPDDEPDDARARAAAQPAGAAAAA